MIRRVTSLPRDVKSLIGISVAEGHDLVDRLVRDWDAESNRFDRPGEVLLEVRLDGRLVAIGGLNRDPYIDDPDVGRIRHVYVIPEARELGIGRTLVTALVDHARGGFTRVRLRTNRPEASQFYLRLGFEETSDEEDSTHQIRL